MIRKKKSIIYLSSKEECELYKYVLKQIMDKYHFYNISIDEITSDTNKKERYQILNNFQKDEDYEIMKL
jgi:superfamily II DNA/RNA helicase